MGDLHRAGRVGDPEIQAAEHAVVAGYGEGGDFQLLAGDREDGAAAHGGLAAGARGAHVRRVVGDDPRPLLGGEVQGVVDRRLGDVRGALLREQVGDELRVAGQRGEGQKQDALRGRQPGAAVVEDVERALLVQPAGVQAHALELLPPLGERLEL